MVKTGRAVLVASAIVAVVSVPALPGLAAGPSPAPTGGAGGLLVKPLPGVARSSGTQAYARDHLLVRFRPGTASARQAAGVAAAGGTMGRSVRSTGYVEVATTDVAASLERLRSDSSVAYAGYDYVRQASTVPDDPGYQPGLQQPYLDLVRLPQAWGVTTGSMSQVVAVVDTGVDPTAPDLAGRVLPGYDFVSDDTNAAPAPPSQACADPTATGHGTFVASVAAANTNNGYGIAGAAWNARILPVRVLDQCGSGYDSDIVTGVTWAADHGATVINLSLGGTAPSAPLQAAMQYAEGKGIPTVVAAGNGGSAVPYYPAAYPEAISVGATDDTGHLTSFSTFGDWVDLAAPGWDTLGEMPRALCADAQTPNPTDCYFQGGGTSFAAPLVSGVTALLRTRFPTWTPDQIRARLERTARDFGPAGVDPYYGYGVPDAYAALGGALASPATDVPVPGVPADDPADAAPLSGGAVHTSFQFAGRSSWYSYAVVADSAVTISAVPDPVSNRGQLPAQLSFAIRAYDVARHLLGTSAPVPDGATATLDVTLPAGTALVEVGNANGSVPSSQPFTLQVTSHGAATPGAPGPAAWVEQSSPQDIVGNPQPPLTVHPTMTFVRAMDPATLTSGSVVLRNGRTGNPVPSTLSYDAPSRVLTIVPDQPLLEGTAYVVTVNAGAPSVPAKDLAGTTMPEAWNWFATPVGSTTLPVQNLASTGSPWGATLSWGLPENGDLADVVVRYAVGGTPPTTSTGTVAYSGSLSAVTVTGLLSGRDYAFAVFAYTRAGSPPSTTVVLRGSTTTLTATPAAPLYGQATSVVATVRTIDGQPAAGRTATLYWRRTGTTAWTALGAATTSPSGQVSLSSKPPWNAQYYVVDVGGAARMGSTATVSVPVRFSVTSAAIPTTALVGQTFHFGGVVAPARPGSPVELEGYWGGTWHLLATVPLSAKSSYSVKQVATRRSIYVYRVYKPADAYVSAGATATFTVTVH